ncbi:MAG: hypothetical protein C0P61_000370 [Bacillota bacterium]
MSNRLPHVDRMAEIILQRPSVTGKELARELGFAQERSVYYWLHKAGYAGLKEFRTAVLTGAYALAAPPVGSRSLRAPQVAEVPLVSSFQRDPGQPREYVVTTQPVSHGAFALTVDSDEYRPLVERNDVLLVDPGQRPGDGDLVLVEAGAGLPILCRVYPSAQPLFVHPVSGRPVRLPAGYERKPGPTVLGRVVGLQRVF